MLRVIGQLVQVYHQERTTDKYLYQENLPAMSEMSLCFWMRLENDDDNRWHDWLVSISTLGTYHIYILIQSFNSAFKCVLITSMDCETGSFQLLPLLDKA